MHKDIVLKQPDLSHLYGDSLDLVKQLLTKEPSERLGAREGISEIKNHPFFNDIVWKDVLRKKYKYQKQYLKIDLTQTNFDYDGEDKFSLGIDIEEELKDVQIDQP